MIDERNNILRPCPTERIENIPSPAIIPAATGNIYCLHISQHTPFEEVEGTDHRITRPTEPPPRQSRDTAHEHSDRVRARIEDERYAYRVPVWD